MYIVTMVSLTAYYFLVYGMRLEGAGQRANQICLYDIYPSHVRGVRYLCELDRKSPI